MKPLNIQNDGSKTEYFDGYSMTTWSNGMRQTNYDGGRVDYDFGNGTMARRFPNNTVIFETNGTLVSVKQWSSEEGNFGAVPHQPAPVAVICK